MYNKQDIQQNFNQEQNRNYQTGGSTSTAPQSSGTSSSGKDSNFWNTIFCTGTSSLGGANAFLPSIGITIQNAQSGDFFTVTNVSGTGFTDKSMQKMVQVLLIGLLLFLL